MSESPSLWLELMPRKTTPEKKSVSLSPVQTRSAITKINRRFQELFSLDLNKLTNETGGNVLDGYVLKINATLRDIYGADSIEYDEYMVKSLKPVFMVWYEGMDSSLRGNMEIVREKVDATLTKLRTLVDFLEEQVGPGEDDASSRILRAYDGLDLHAEISRAASGLYSSGHYANAVEAAVKALNALVRLRSDLEHDGVTLMERAFSPSNPVLKFNALQDQSDKDEQKGFMQMFAGAVSGLRNPRAHSFVHDEPERALEFIAFISLLAKLLDEAER